MSSSVHFKFKSQKEPSRVTFDGTSISVFNLKREIINSMKMGDGTDFELAIYNESTNEEYLDDLEEIPRSSFVVARRLPPIRPGKGGASRYVSGKPPVNARAPAAGAPPKKNKALDMSNAQTEEDRFKAMLSLSDEQWRQKQQEMANETRIPIAGSKNFPKKVNIPEGEPPRGYICYRCQQKGHWIQACPTNDDPTFEGQKRRNRTTGIPRSMLKIIDKSELDNLDETTRQNVMLDANGDLVLAQADEREWKKHQEKVKASAAAQEQAESGDKELQERGLECPIDKRMFVDPMKTPCCGKTYCNECITNALFESDLTCPGCNTENVVVENLVPDDETKEKIKAYQAKKAGSKKAKSASPESSPKSPTANIPDSSLASSRSQSKSPTSSTADSTVTSKKRTADEAADDNLKSDIAPAMKRQKSEEQPKDVKDVKESNEKFATPVTNQSENLPFNQMMPPDMSTMMQNMSNMPNMNFPMPNMPMPMPGMPFMPMPGMMNPSMMPNFMPPNFNPMSGMNGMNGMNAVNGMNFPNQQNGMFPPNFNSPMMNINNNNRTGYNQQNMYPNQGYQQQRQQQHNLNGSGMNGMNGVPKGPKNGQVPVGPAVPNKFSNQQRHQGNEEDNAYMRQPVNPHRHQNRQKRARPSDYREL